MIKLAPFESCTGCTACMNSCSHNAIVMAEDAEGFILKVCQNAHLLFFTHKAPTFTSWGFVI
ncbi:4Fe-4S binding protein, partial [Phocaeicola vulgatus]|uniref:4Fe-4S binding protein n=1 Tax=Phocaeicola vulgatus TaxID=821 RepID=UPI0039B69082